MFEYLRRTPWNLSYPEYEKIIPIRIAIKIMDKTIGMNRIL